MNRQLDEANLAVQNAREALRENRRTDARQWAEQAASLAPHMEDPWLILAAIASPHASLEYIQQSAEDQSGQPARTPRHGMGHGTAATDATAANRRPQMRARIRRTPLQAGFPPLHPRRACCERRPPRPKRRPGFADSLVGIGLLVCVAVAASAAMSPVLASIVQQASSNSSGLLGAGLHPQAYLHTRIAAARWRSSRQPDHRSIADIRCREPGDDVASQISQPKRRSEGRPSSPHRSFSPLPSRPGPVRSRSNTWPIRRPRRQLPLCRLRPPAIPVAAASIGST